MLFGGKLTFSMRMLLNNKKADDAFAIRPPVEALFTLQSKTSVVSSSKRWTGRCQGKERVVARPVSDGE
jgi:hypothetical protein